MGFIALTGATGFLGRAICARPELRNQIVAIGRRTGDVIVDLRENPLPWNDPTIRDAEILVHAAASVRPDAFSENIDIATNVLAFLPQQIRSLVLISSTYVYAPSATATDEGTKPAPIDSYGFAKLAIERLFHCVAKGRGLPLIILRPCSIYGLGDPHKKAISIFLKAVRAGQQPQLRGNVTMKRDYLYIEDAASGVILAADKARAGWSGTYNICTGQAVAPLDVANILCKLAGLPPVTAPNELRANEHYLYSPSLAERDLKFKADIGIQDGLCLMMKENAA